LLRLGHADLAELLLAKYVEESGDYALYQVVDFYQSYRAFVRGKIAGMVAEDPLSSERTRTAAMLEARRCFRLALAVERPALLPPVLIAVGGVIAAGKSCVAEQLGRALPAVVINTDSTRKQLAGIAATEPVHAAAWSGLYGEDNTQRVYAELFQRALIVLHSGRSVVLDASFRTRALRAAARDTARAAGFGFRFVECTAPASVCRARLLERARGPSVSDARAELFDEFVRNFEPVTELPAAEHCILDTASPMTVASLLDQAGLEHLPAWAP
jgi:uncharacterized protein